MFHPHNQHHGGGALPIKPVDAPLYVITSISNPKRYRQRYHLYRQFEKYIADSGAILYTIEQCFGEREFEVTDPCNPRHIRVQSISEVWHKENMLNLAMHRLPSDWKYVAWIDADVQFARPDWVYETIHLLQHYQFLQMFSQAVDLNPHFEILDDSIREGVVSYWQRNGHCNIRNKKPGYGTGYGYGAGNKHPGYAWAARREAIDHVGGLIDWAVVGSADWHMAAALMGQLVASIGPSVAEACPTYVEWCKIWEENAIKFIKYNVGFMDGLVMHYYHGKKVNRHYFDRWSIISNNAFNPQLDLKRDWQGLWQLTDRNLKLRDDLRGYFATRDEDDRS